MSFGGTVYKMIGWMLLLTGVNSVIGAGRLIMELNAPFSHSNVYCMPNSPVSWEEHLIQGHAWEDAFLDLKQGDILLTPCSHTFFWRNGHVGLVIDEKEGKTLEAAVLGRNSCIQSIDKWRTYPAVAVLRMEGLTERERKELVENAVALLHDIPYRLLVNTDMEADKKGNIGGTNCSHLVWKAYQLAGYDLNTRGGPIVTPMEIGASPLLTVTEIHGWRK